MKNARSANMSLLTFLFCAGTKKFTAIDFALVTVTFFMKLNGKSGLFYNFWNDKIVQ
jgi:hypothetical protein